MKLKMLLGRSWLYWRPFFHLRPYYELLKEYEIAEIVLVKALPNPKKFWRRDEVFFKVGQRRVRGYVDQETALYKPLIPGDIFFWETQIVTRPHHERHGATKPVNRPGIYCGPKKPQRLQMIAA